MKAYFDRDLELTEQCPHCYRCFPPLCEHSRPGYCPKCQGWLGSLEPLRRANSKHPRVDWAKYLPDPLEFQLLWVDEVERLLTQTPKPFFPPKIASQNEDQWQSVGEKRFKPYPDQNGQEML